MEFWREKLGLDRVPAAIAGLDDAQLAGEYVLSWRASGALAERQIGGKLTERFVSAA